MYQYSFPTNISFGAGVVKQLPHYLKKHQLSRPLIVSDSLVKELPFFKTILNELKVAGIHSYLFTEIHKNPLKSDVMAGNKVFAQGADSIIGLGGGAPIDVARAIALSIHHPRDLFDYDDLEGGSALISEPIPHFITIPTTSGTGSEVGRAAIISEDHSKKKRILFHPSLIAKQVFADPELTYDLPPSITAATGMDALTHNMEAYIAKGFHPLCEGVALEGIRLIINSLQKAVKAPDAQSRENMMIASLMGAVAFQKGLGIVHSLSHPLSTVLDMHHGLANAINLPYGLEFNRQTREEHFKRMAVVMDLSQETSIRNYLLDFNDSIGLPTNLGACGVTEEIIDDLAELAQQDFCLPSNPREASRDEIVALYKEAL